jgi:hypothetical protein
MAINRNRNTLGQADPYQDPAKANYVNGGNNDSKSLVGRATDQSSDVTPGEQSTSDRYRSAQARAGNIGPDVGAGGVAIGAPDQLVTRSDGGDSGTTGVGKSIS